MKKLLTLFFAIFIGAITFGQAPEKFNYQAVVRNSSGESVVNQTVGVRISILEGSSLGPEVFAETFAPTTNGYGLINLQIGTGTNSGPFLSSIDWSANNYYIKVEIDPTGGTSYSVSSLTQLISVPYALHAATVDDADDADADPTNEYNTGGILNGDSLEITDGGGTIKVDVSSLTTDPDMDPSNEIQTLSKVGQVVTLSGGGGAFTDDVDDADNSLVNELNSNLVLNGNTLELTDPGGTLYADLSSLGDDADADPTNEFQTINLAGNIVTLSNSGGSFSIDDADADPTNEFQTINLAGNIVTLSNSGGSFSIDDADADPSNEFQTISKVGNTVTLSNSGGTFTVDDADADPSNEYNTTAVLNGTDLEITDGGGTIIVDMSTLGGGNATDELNTSFFLDGDTIKITDAGGTMGVDLSPLITGGGDLSTSNELNTSAVLNGTDLEITDPGGTLVVDLSSLGGGNPTDELNTSVVLNATTLEVTDAGGTLTADLSSLVDDADADPSNELNTSAFLNGTDLEITDAGGTLVVDLSSLGGGGNPTDELNTSVVLNSTTLEVTDAGGTLTADLSSLVNDADADPTNELITGAVLNGTDLEITDAGGTTIVDLSSLGGGPQYKIGQYQQGGIIIYVDSTGDHGLVAAIDDFPAEQWDTGGFGGSNSTTGASSYTDGAANTAAIIAAFGGSGYAAATCDSYTGGGFTDWYLPSLLELEYIMEFAFLLDNFDPTTVYWSSTELPNPFNSYAVDYPSRTAQQNSQVGTTARVRPVRAF